VELYTELTDSKPATKMTCPGNGIYVVQGEMAILLTAMRRGSRWSSHTHQVQYNLYFVIAMHVHVKIIILNSMECPSEVLANVQHKICFITPKIPVELVLSKSFAVSIICSYIHYTT
jgi:hypothetical protein